MHIIDNRPSLTAETMCGLILQGSQCVLNEPATDWTINVAAGGTPITVRIIKKKKNQINS